MTKVLDDIRHKERLVISIIFIVIFNLLLFDVWSDLSSGASVAHVAFEAILLCLALLGIIVQLVLYYTQKRNIRNLNLNLSQVRKDLDSYKQESKAFIEGLSAQIDRQLEIWGLTKAEKEISLLILKGLNNKEISQIRHTSESTVRQQISSIFQKSQLSSRLELSAFFLEDLLIIKPDQSAN